jgi:DNA repair photolyase
MIRPRRAEDPPSEANEARTTSPPAAPAIRGRGAAENPADRFTELGVEPDREGIAAAAAAAGDDEVPNPVTKFHRDASRSLISTNDSPDLSFGASFNPYRGCEHGCVYCFARPTHEYFGLSAGLDFETRIFVKEEAPLLLRKELSSPKWRPQVLVMSGVTDCYQPIERELRITRRCLEVLVEFRNPVAVVTKNALVARDADLLADLARDRAAAVYLSVTTLDDELAAALEPRASRPAKRLAAIASLARAGVPVGVMVAPLIPGLTDHEMPAILAAAAQAGATQAGYTLLRLPYGVKELFDRWLERHRPDRREKILQRIRSTRGGRLNDPRFGTRLKGEGEWARAFRQLFDASAARAGLNTERRDLSTEAFRRPGPSQGSLFD